MMEPDDAAPRPSALRRGASAAAQAAVVFFSVGYASSRALTGDSLIPTSARNAAAQLGKFAREDAGSPSSAATTLASETSGPPDVRGMRMRFATPEYGEVLNSLYPWSNIAEPHREVRAVLEVDKSSTAPNLVAVADPSRMWCVWSFSKPDGSWKLENVGAACAESDSDESVFAATSTLYAARAGVDAVAAAELAGVGAFIKFEGTGTYDVSVVVGHASSAAAPASPGDAVELTAHSSVTGSVMVKYVRREVRSLSDRDRELFFNAVSVMQRVPTEVGQRMWGSSYKSKDYFNRVHLYYGGRSDCDHWHKGAGFVTSHIGFTLEYEQALQAIFPATSVPYWDFTIESTFYEPATFRSSPIFDSDWFGAASPDNTLHTVTEGRWAFVPTMHEAAGFSQVVNSFGLLRAPWNNDPSPFSTRHDAIYGYANNLKPSGCSEYDTSLQKSTWMSFTRVLNAAAHGHIHELLGGSWNHALAETNDNEAFPAALTFAHSVQALSKELWRTGYVSCPSAETREATVVTDEMEAVFSATDTLASAAAQRATANEGCDIGNTHWSECRCACSAETLSGTTEHAYEVLERAGIIASVQFYDDAHHLVASLVDGNGTTYATKLPGHTEADTAQIYQKLVSLLCDPGHIGDMFQATSTNDLTFWVLHPTVDRLWHYKRLANDSQFDDTWDPYNSCYGHNPDDFQPFSGLFDARAEATAAAAHPAPGQPAEIAARQAAFDAAALEADDDAAAAAALNEEPSSRRRRGLLQAGAAQKDGGPPGQESTLPPPAMDSTDASVDGPTKTTSSVKSKTKTKSTKAAPAATKPTKVGVSATPPRGAPTTISASGTPPRGAPTTMAAPAPMEEDLVASGAGGSGTHSSAPLYYTNMQLKALLKPDAEPLPYMYDNFAWPHCTLLGYTMSNKLADYGLADDKSNATAADTVYAFDFSGAH